jgi:putative hydrolase of HD superfamily
MKKLYFVRHGFSQMNELGQWAGRINTPLTDKGRVQAKQAGQAAKDLGIDYIVTSPLVRAYETAQIIAHQIGYPLDKVHTSSLFIERDFGAAEGQPYNPDLDLDGIADIETTDTLLNRAHLALEFLQTVPGKTILVVGHGAIGRALRHHLHSDMPFSSPAPIENAKITEFDYAKFLNSAGTKPGIQRLFDLQDFLHKFHAIERVVYLPGYPKGQATKADRAETDTEHSYTLAMTAWFLAQYFPELDTDKCIKAALVHDLVEIYAGDTYVFADKTQLDTKVEREQAALQQIAQEWQDFPEMISIIKTYEQLATPEHRFVYALDKIMPPLVIFMSKGYTWQKHKITFEMHHDAKKNKIAKSPEILAYYNQLLDLMHQHPDYFHQEKLV